MTITEKDILALEDWEAIVYDGSRKETEQQSCDELTKLVKSSRIADELEHILKDQVTGCEFDTSDFYKLIQTLRGAK